MTESDSQETHRGLVGGALGASAIAAVAAGIDGFRSGSLALIALALDFSLAALACWWALDAGEVRRRQRAAAQPTESDHDGAQRLFAEARSMHFVFVTVPAVIVVALTAFRFWADLVGVSAPLPPAHATAAGVIALALCAAWLVLSESFASISAHELPEGAALSQAFREARWASLAAAVGLIGSQAVTGLDVWIGRALSIWVLGIGLEQAVRGLIAWFAAFDRESAFQTPISLLLREAVLVRGSPLASLFDTVEARFGLSFRSSWGIQFVRRTTLPVLALLALIAWGFTGLSVVEVHQFGVEERLGRVVPEPLPPGLHVTLPWPFGRVQRFPVKTVSTMLVGFEEDEAAAKKLGLRAMLWTQAHAKEYSLVLGTGTEVVAVNAVVSYKIHEDAPRFLDFVYRAQDPTARLETCAYRCLREETQSATLAQVLTENRLEFARRIRDRLRAYADDERLGIDVIDVGIVNLHPPVEVAGDYLDVISAGIDATRTIEEARAESWVKQETAAGEGRHLAAQARIDAAKRLGRATGESAEFVAAAEAHAESPVATRWRLWFDAMERTLSGKRLFVLDPSLARGNGDVLLDLRPSGGSSVIPSTSQ